MIYKIDDTNYLEGIKKASPEGDAFNLTKGLTNKA